MWESAGSQDPGYISLQHNEPLLQSGGREKKKQEKRMRHLSNVYLRAAEAFHNHICYNAFQFAEKKGRF